MAAYGSAKPIASGRGRACGLERQGRRLIAVDHHHDREGPLVGAPMVPTVPECVRALSFPKRSSIPQLPHRSLIDRPKLSKLGGREMAILRLLQNSQLAAEDVAGLVAAYEKTLRALYLVDRSDPITELVARKVIEIGQSGVRDPAQISRLAVKALS